MTSSPFLYFLKRVEKNRMKKSCRKGLSFEDEYDIMEGMKGKSTRQSS